MEGAKLEFTEDALMSVSKKAIERKTGARGLRSIIEGMLLDTMFELPDLEGIEKVVVGKDTVDDGKPPVYVYADGKKKAGKKSKDEKEPEAAAT